MSAELATFIGGRVLGIPVVAVHGEVDLSNASLLRSASLDAVGPVDPGLVLDLSPTGFLDSSAIRTLLDVQRDLEARRQRLALVVPATARVATVLVLCGVPTVVLTTDDVHSAVDALRGAEG